MLEMFNTLLRQLRLSIDYALTGSYDGAISLGTKIIKEHEERMFQEAVIKTIGGPRGGALVGGARWWGGDRVGGAGRGRFLTGWVGQGAASTRTAPGRRHPLKLCYSRTLEETESVYGVHSSRTGLAGGRKGRRPWMPRGLRAGLQTGRTGPPPLQSAELIIPSEPSWLRTPGALLSFPETLTTAWGMTSEATGAGRVFWSRLGFSSAS